MHLFYSSLLLICELFRMQILYILRTRDRFYPLIAISITHKIRMHQTLSLVGYRGVLSQKLGRMYVIHGIFLKFTIRTWKNLSESRY